MSRYSNKAHRLYLKIFHGRDVWHQRFYRPSVSIVNTSDRIFFSEGNITVETYALPTLKGLCQGRCNLLLSGPSVRGIREVQRLSDFDLICVNGSPSLFGEEIPEIALYHVNDTTYIRSSVDDFLKYSRRAKFTAIDYRSMFWLLENVPDQLSEVRLVVYDSWAYPMHLSLGEVQRLTCPPEHQGVYFSKDLSSGLAVGGTVAYTAAQIAWHAGYQSMYIYGLDLTDSGRFYKEHSGQPQMLDKAFDRVIKPSFELLMRETKDSGFQVFNCNPDSRLSSGVIPQLEINESFAHSY